MKPNSGYLNWKLQWLLCFFDHNEHKFDQILLKQDYRVFLRVGIKKAFVFLLRGEIKPEKAICDKLPPWKNLKWVFFTAWGQSHYEAATVEAHHKVNVTVFRERSERSSFSVLTVRMKCQNFQCRLGLSQLLLPMLIFPLTALFYF